MLFIRGLITFKPLLLIDEKEMSGQCDQILYTFATLAKNRSLWLFVDGLFSFWINLNLFWLICSTISLRLKQSKLRPIECRLNSAQINIRANKVTLQTSIVETRHTDMQPSSGRSLYQTRHMYCTPPGTMPRSLQEQAGRWCHEFACLVVTIEVYGHT